MSLQSLNQLFDEALAIESEEERLRFIDAKCGQNDPLKRELFGLLAAHGKGNVLLEAPTQAFELVSGLAGAGEESEGSTVGSYKLLQRLGEGGMGVVFMAEQLHPIRRKVALKIIREGMNSKQIIARFEAEREALARLDHPHVTRILDAGVTPSGRPYFAMELVRGTHITQFCNSHRVPIEQRLALLEQVCMVIHHAHQKGILHRDIKPSNVMITLHDGVPVPKVIDFGIAKALDRPLTEQTLFTRYGDLVGTPEYMSPEQAEMSGLDLDVRTDIFSLGVLLYELLTGSTPLTHDQIQGKGLLKIFETIRDSEAESPSLRVTKTLAAAETIAEQRQSTPAQLPRMIAGELDWITMKCIAKDRNERYESAAALAKEIRRFLNGEPVDAAAPSFAYRTRKFYQKHRTVSIATIACGLLLLVTTAFSSYWAWSSQRSQSLAQQRAKELALKSEALEEAKARLESALDRATKAERKAEAMARAERFRAIQERARARFFAEQMQEGLDKILHETRGFDLKPADADVAAHVVEGAPMITIGNTEFERPAVVLPMLKELSQVKVRVFGKDRGLVRSQDATDGSQVAAEVAGPEGIDIRQAISISPPSQEVQGALLILPARYYEILLEDERQEFGNQDVMVATALACYAEALLREGNADRWLAAENHLREALGILEASKDEYPFEQLVAYSLFRVVLDRQGKKVQAEEALRRSLELIRTLDRSQLTPNQLARLSQIEASAKLPTSEYQGPYSELDQFQ